MSGRTRSDDNSPGDGRQPYSDIGGPAGRHAQTHDVRREDLTNPTGPDRSMDEFADDIAPATPSAELRGHTDDSVAATDDKAIYDRLPELTGEELGRLSIVAEGTQLDQGGVYLDLNDRQRGEFKVVGKRQAGPQNRFVAKKDTDYELWNRLGGAEHATSD